jgi:hypothetical protein
VAGTVSELIGQLPLVTAPGPLPAEFIAKMPKLLATTVMGTGLLATPL